MFACLFGCVGSQGWHSGSSLCCVRAFLAAHGPSGCGMLACVGAELLQSMWDLSFLTKRWNPSPLHYRRILSHRTTPGSPRLEILSDFITEFASCDAVGWDNGGTRDRASRLAL